MLSTMKSCLAGGIVEIYLLSRHSEQANYTMIEEVERKDEARVKFVENIAKSSGLSDMRFTSFRDGKANKASLTAYHYQSMPPWSPANCASPPLHFDM